MKAITSLLFFLIIGPCKAQDSSIAVIDSPVSNSELILDYIQDNMGKKVGNGICSELIVGVSDYLESFGVVSDSMYEIEPSAIMPGDVIRFHKVVCSDGEEIDNHIGFVYSLLPNGNLSYANQNVIIKKGNYEKVVYNGKKISVDKDSHVELSVIHIPSIVSGKVSYYRLW